MAVGRVYLNARASEHSKAYLKRSENSFISDPDMAHEALEDLLVSDGVLAHTAITRLARSAATRKSYGYVRPKQVWYQPQQSWCSLGFSSFVSRHFLAWCSSTPFCLGFRPTIRPPYQSHFYSQPSPALCIAVT